MNKKLEVKRLCIYLALSFGISWAIFFAFSLTGHKWDGSKPYLESFVGLGMLVPFISNILTRWITKEGFAMTGKDSLMLGISLKDKKWIFFLFAMLAPWLYFELGGGLLLAIFPKSFDPEYYKILEIEKTLTYWVPFVCIVSGTIGSFAALGEEGGWRGYMMPKLMNLMSMPKAIIAGGIIWGIWHAPLTAVGHNFGTDYPGFPYLGILLMCVDCTFMGIMLTYITIKTESIWPAAIMHAVNNQNPTILKCFANMEIIESYGSNQLVTFSIILAPITLLGGICFWLMLKD